MIPCAMTGEFSLVPSLRAGIEVTQGFAVAQQLTASHNKVIK